VPRRCQQRQLLIEKLYLIRRTRPLVRMCMELFTHDRNALAFVKVIPCLSVPQIAAMFTAAFEKWHSVWRG